MHKKAFDDNYISFFFIGAFKNTIIFTNREPIEYHMIKYKLKCPIAYKYVNLELFKMLNLKIFQNNTIIIKITHASLTFYNDCKFGK